MLLVQAVGSWLQYIRLVKYGDFSADLLEIPKGKDPYSLGKLCGWAAAGDDRAMEAIDRLVGKDHDLVTVAVGELRDLKLGVPEHLLGDET